MSRSITSIASVGVATATLLVLAVSPTAQAATLVEDFNAGIDPNLWRVTRVDAAGAPWTLTAPDAQGRLQISKPADSDPCTALVVVGAGLQST